MKDNCVKKGLVVGIILLFAGTTVITAIAQDTEKPLLISRGNWLYVGGGGPGNYTRIQDAINASSEGDTIFVYDESSPYYEHLIIAHRIFLIGENRETTIIDGNGFEYVVLLAYNASYVTIAEFTIRNGFRGIVINTNNNVIAGNIIDDISDDGILMITGSDGNTVAGNIITHTASGIALDRFTSSQNKIYNNCIENNMQGIKVYGLPYLKNTVSFYEENSCEIYQNTLRNNDYGIFVFSLSYVNISHNDITNNSYGIDLEIGWDGYCSNNTIFQNNISRNEHGITMYIEESDYSRGIKDNNIVENNITYNGKGVEMTNYYLYGIGFNTFYHNNFIGNTQTVNLENSIYNHWVGNYWGNPRLLPYPIVIKLEKWIFSIPWVNFDWRPAKTPYDIGVRE
jgi:parallel beta-helix repeat protein